MGYTALYMAALAFTAYGVHWFALGYNKYKEGDPTVDGFMAIAFLWISITGAFVFFKAGDMYVGTLFVLLALVYISDIPASLLKSAKWTRVKGFWHLVTGTWLADVSYVCRCNHICAGNAPAALEFIENC